MFGAPVMQAQMTAPVPAATSSWTFTPAVVSQYMFRGVRLGGPAIQPTLEYGYGALAVGVWANFPFNKKVPGQSDPEYDFYGSYTIPVNSALSIVPGATLYYYPRATESNGFFRSTFEPNLAINYTVAGFKLTPKIYYDLVLEGATAEFTAAYAYPLKDFGTELNFTATYGSYKWKEFAEDTSPAIKNWGDYWLVGMAMPFAINSSSKVTLGVAYTKGNDNYLKQGSAPKFSHSSAVGRGVVTVAYSLTF